MRIGGGIRTGQASLRLAHEGRIGLQAEPALEAAVEAFVHSVATQTTNIRACLGAKPKSE